MRRRSLYRNRNVVPDWEEPDYFYTGMGTPIYGHGLYIRDDGFRVWHCEPWHGEASKEQVHQHNLSYPFDLSTITGYVTSTSPISTLTGLYFSPDGTKMFVSDNISQLRAFNLTAPWDITSGTLEANIDITEYNNGWGLHFSPDGTKMFGGGGNSGIWQHELTAPWDITSKGAGTKIKDETDIDDISFDSNGMRCAVVGRNSRNVRCYILNNPYDFTGARLMIMTALNMGFLGCDFTSDGSKLVVSNDGNIGIFTIN